MRLKSGSLAVSRKADRTLYYIVYTYSL